MELLQFVLVIDIVCIDSTQFDTLLDYSECMYWIISICCILHYSINLFFYCTTFESLVDDLYLIWYVPKADFRLWEAMVCTILAPTVGPTDPRALWCMGPTAINMLFWNVWKCTTPERLADHLNCCGPKSDFLGPVRCLQHSRMHWSKGY